MKLQFRNKVKNIYFFAAPFAAPGRQYLPPQQGGSPGQQQPSNQYGPPSSQYGAPSQQGGQGGFGQNGFGQNGFGGNQGNFGQQGSPQSQYGPPPSSQGGQSISPSQGKTNISYILLFAYLPQRSQASSALCLWVMFICRLFHLKKYSREYSFIWLSQSKIYPSSTSDLKALCDCLLTIDYSSTLYRWK